LECKENLFFRGLLKCLKKVTEKWVRRKSGPEMERMKTADYTLLYHEEILEEL
jgi:hypothetical protein